MAEHSSPNLFILLELDPERSWDQVEFERQLQKKRQEWSRLVNMPTSKGIEAKKNLGYIPELQKIAADEVRRKVQANEARAGRAAAQSEQRQAFEKQLSLLMSKGHLLEEELKHLIAQFASVLSEKEIRKRVTVPVQKAEASSRPTRPALEPSKAKDIQQKLTALGKSSLYDFLGLNPGTQSRLLLQQATILYKSVQDKATKTADDTLTSQLTGYCLELFKNESERAKYDETIRLQQYDELKAQIDVMGKVPRRINAQQMLTLLKEARQKNLDPVEAEAIIIEYAAQKKYAVRVSETAAHESATLQRCGYCGRLNEKDKKHCATCGELLQEPCPRCGRSISSNDTACGACGFPSGNRSFVLLLLNEVEQARQRGDYQAAAATLVQATDAWPGQGNDPISQQIKGLEAKVVPEKKGQEDLLNQLETACQQKRFYAARTTLTRLEQTMPANASQLTGYRSKIDTRLSQVEIKMNEARRLGPNDPERAILAYQEALQLCQDAQEARDMLARTPPASPTNLQVQTSGQIVRLSWTGAPSAGVSYAIVRKAHARPISPTDGQILATVASLVYDDTTAEVGLPFFYTIFSDRAGIHSRSGATLDRPAFLTQDVHKLAASIGDQQVKLTWEAPSNVHAILIVRAENSPTISLQTGYTIHPLDNSQAIDNDVQNGQRYFYTVFCQFKDENGQPQTTRGITIEATPQPPPAPINDLQIVASGPLHAREVQLRWQPPAKGDVVIVQVEKPTGLLPGTVMAQIEVANLGQLLTTSQREATVKINQLGSYYFLPVVMFQGSAYIGQEQLYVCIDDVSGFSTQNLGHAIRLQWQWPPNCQEVLIVYSHQDWSQPHHPDSTTIPLTRAQYDLKGYYDIHNPAFIDYYLTVFAIVNHSGQKTIASGQSKEARKRITLASRITLSYQIKKSLIGQKLSLYINVKGQGTLPVLLLTRKQMTLPMNQHDGQIIFRLPATAIQNDQLTFRLPAESAQRQGYAKIFLEDEDLYDIVTIHHPALDKLRLF